uniref:Uncharacterized protein n=1 Tax=Candidatus Kentrum sp. TC TaxID=2126339 RepID=A0A451A038_9GAMM|nr:MAG: hypothetical protein BECKTC1821F_GA0114240_103316 [Candidatus Kentron sp. TC]
MSADQKQEALVLDPTRQLRYQDVMVDSVEELFQIHIHYPAGPFLPYTRRICFHTFRVTIRPWISLPPRCGCFVCGSCS